jgi:nucleoside-diphosphate-sugar epimerase
VKTKYLAEKGVERAAQRGLHTVTIRPRAIFGPGDQVLLPRLIKALDKGGIPRFKKEGVWVDVSYVDNVAESLVLALEKGKAGAHYNITNDEPWELFELFKELSRLTQREMKVRNVPYPLARWFARGSDFISCFTGKEPLFTPYTVGVLAHSQTFGIQLAKRELGYVPKISVKEGIKRYAAWWCENQKL